MIKPKILFLCVHNSARSQMAEAFMNKYGSDYFHPESAGLEPGILNPLAIEVMKEEGIDISSNPTKDVFTMFKEGRIFHYVITVCDAKNSERCPIFPGISKKLAWDFDDPSKFTGTWEERLEKTRKIRDQIKDSIMQFIEENKPAQDEKVSV